MKRFFTLFTLFAFLLTGLSLMTISCGDDDDDDNDDSSQQEEIVGGWLSAGTDVAPLLLSLGFTQITADFRADNTYDVYATDTSGAVVQFTGTYVIAASGVGNIYTITLNQNSPTAITSEGIFEIDATANPDTMMYEIVQTSPDIGATPPTPAGGFGSTSGGAFGDTNIQKYIRTN